MNVISLLPCAPALSESAPTSLVFVCLAALLMIAVVTLLVLQVMIIRQIGVLHLRLGPEIKSDPPPTTAKIEAVTLDNGSIRRFREHPLTACLLISSTCDACERILESLAASRRTQDWIVGLAGGTASLEEVRQRFGLPAGVLFDGRELAKDLKVVSVPLFVLLDSGLRVVGRSMADSVESIEKRFLAASLAAHSSADKSRKNAGHSVPASSN